MSPLESPGMSAKTDVSVNTKTSLDATSIETAENHAHAHEHGMLRSKSMPIHQQKASTNLKTVQSLGTLGRKKRKAPAPPPLVGGTLLPIFLYSLTGISSLVDVIDLSLVRVSST